MIFFFFKTFKHSIKEIIRISFTIHNYVLFSNQTSQILVKVILECKNVQNTDQPTTELKSKIREKNFKMQQDNYTKK